MKKFHEPMSLDYSSGANCDRDDFVNRIMSTDNPFFK